MPQKYLQPDTITYSVTITACGKGSALKLLVEMRRAGVAADTVTYSAAISACEEGQQWQGALVFVGGAEAR